MMAEEFKKWFNGVPFDEDVIPKLGEAHYPTVREVARQAFEAGQEAEREACVKAVYSTSDCGWPCACWRCAVIRTCAESIKRRDEKTVKDTGE